jgi:hypothetical protein
MLFFSPYLLLCGQGIEQSDFIVLHNNDTLRGTVSYINERAVNRGFYKKVRITNAKGKTKKYKRENISSFQVNGTEYRSFWLYQPPQRFPPVSVVNPQYNIDEQQVEHYFLRVVSTGKLSHYELEWFDQGDSQLYAMALLKKGHQGYFMRADQGIIGLKKKLLQRYFADCDEVRQKIKDKTLKKVKQLVEAYNTTCH